MYESWYDNMKLKYGEKPKLCYMDWESFIVSIKTKDIYTDVVNVLPSRDLEAKKKCTYWRS